MDDRLGYDLSLGFGRRVLLHTFLSLGLVSSELVVLLRHDFRVMLGLRQRVRLRSEVIACVEEADAENRPEDDLAERAGQSLLGARKE